MANGALSLAEKPSLPTEPSQLLIVRFPVRFATTVLFYFSPYLVIARVSLWLVLLAGLSAVSGCVRRGAVRAADGTAPAYAQRLVLALDGIDYRDVMAARARGLFAEFREPSRLISTFPSISDVAWHDILGVMPPRGYQRIYFSTAYHEMVGAPLDAIRPIEFEERMDMAFGTKFHHLSAYVASNSVARKEISTATRDFFKFTDQSTVYVYNVGPDALQHTRGDLEAYLRHLDSQLLALQREYHKRVGHPLEIVVLSDHGHNHVSDAKFLPIAKELQLTGFHSAERLSNPNDVAFSVDGVTTGFGVFVTSDSVTRVAKILANMDGVEIVSSRESDHRFLIQNRDHRAWVETRLDRGVVQYRYAPDVGDPLEYRDIAVRMIADGVSDSLGFASGMTWLQYTAMVKYPAALERIVRGHTSITLNAAPILVSVALGRQVGLGPVSIANRLRPLGGTHGSLDSSSSLGVVMTNFVATSDDVTERVRDQFGGFADLGGIQHPPSGARLVSTTMKFRDPRRPTYDMLGDQAYGEDQPLVEVWLTAEQLQWAQPGGGFFVDVQRVGPSGEHLESISVSHLPIPDTSLAERPPNATPIEWITSASGRHFLVAIDRLIRVPLVPSATYSLRIAIDRLPSRKSDLNSLSREVATLTVRTTADGRIWPY